MKFWWRAWIVGALLYAGASADLLLDYRMDGCGWSGQSGEVKDSSGNGYDGTAHNGATPEEGDGGLCRVADMGGRYLSPDTMPHVGDTWSMSLWVRFPLVPTDDQIEINGYDYFVIGSIDGTGDLGFFAKESDGDNYKWGVYDNDGTLKEISLGEIQDGWHHVVQVVDGGETALYMDGDYVGKVKIYTSGDVKYVATSTDGEDTQTIGATIDEFKLFDTALSDDEIADMYDNESAGKNYDGSDRYCTLCPTPPACNIGSGLTFSTYSIADSDDHYADSYTEFNRFEQDFGTLDYLFGAGKVSTVDTTGSDNNPFHEGTDDTYLGVFDGYLYIPEAGVYSLAVNGDDAVEAVLNGGEDYYGWYGGHAADGTDHHRDFIFGEAGYYRLKFRHQEWNGADNYQLYWKRPGQSDYEIVPEANLFRCVPPEPVAEYRMEGCDVGDAAWLADSAGGDDDATYRNDDGLVSVAKGAIYQGTDIAGSEEDRSRINAFIAGVSPKELGDRGSVAFWFASHTPWNDGEDRILVDATDGDSAKYFLLGLTADGYLRYWLEDSNDGDFHADSQEAFNFGAEEWVHIVFTWDIPGKRYRLFVNGREVALNVSKDTAGGDEDDGAPDTLPLHFGDISTDGYDAVYDTSGLTHAANGRFDEVVLFKRDLPEPHVVNLYAYGLGKRTYNGEARLVTLCPVQTGCEPQTGLFLATYDIADSSVAKPANHEEYEAMESQFATDSYRFGEGVVDTIDTTGGDNNPFSEDPDDKYLSIFKGFIYIPEGGDYAFAVNGDDAVEVLFNGGEDYYGWYGGHAADGTDHNRVFHFVKEGYYRLKFRHQDWTGSDSYQLYWRRDGDFEIVPSDNLFYCGEWLAGKAYRFDAFDTWRDLGDRNISTKVAARAFDLKVVALDEAGEGYQEFNGTVCARAVDAADPQAGLSGWYKLRFEEANESVLSGMSLAAAYKSVRIELAWQSDADSDCPLDREDNATLSSDAFAVRPDRFEIVPPAQTLYAGVDFNLTFRALDASGGATADYNESTDTSVRLEYNETLANCRTGLLRYDAVAFGDGTARTTASYDETGRIVLRIYEEEGSEFARIDADDTAASQRLIEQNTTALRVVAHHFDLNATLYNTQEGNFTYLSRDLNMSAYLDLFIAARNADGGLVQNFIDGCYAEALALSWRHAEVETERLAYIGTLFSDADEQNATPVWSVEKNGDVTLQIAAQNFSAANARVDSNGTTAVRLYFNFDRNASLPVAPFGVWTEEINLSDTLYPEVTAEGYTTTDGNVTFYYGRVMVEDLTTSLADADHLARFAVFGEGTVADFVPLSLHWYQNGRHNGGALGNLLDYNATDGPTLADAVDGGVTLADYGDDPIQGVQPFVVRFDRDETVRRIIHLAVPSWLWYVPLGFGGTYDYTPGSADSDCGRHPCFIYTHLGATAVRGVLSGDFNGSDFNATGAAVEGRKGVKLFR